MGVVQSLSRLCNSVYKVVPIEGNLLPSLLMKPGMALDNVRVYGARAHEQAHMEHSVPRCLCRVFTMLCALVHETAL